MTIFLPPLRKAARPFQIQAEGRVVRVEPAGEENERIGFAVLNQSVVLRQSEASDEAERNHDEAERE